MHSTHLSAIAAAAVRLVLVDVDQCPILVRLDEDAPVMPDVRLRGGVGVRRAVRVESALEHVVYHVQMRVAGDVHRIEREDGAGDVRESHIHVNGNGLAAGGVDVQLVVGFHLEE